MILLEIKPLGLDEFGEPLAPITYKDNFKLKELAKPNCRRCHGRGEQTIDFPHKWVKQEVCGCVCNNLIRKENKKRIAAGDCRMKPDQEVVFLAGFNK